VKFKSTDESYLKARAEISQRYGKRELWSLMDHWPLYCGIANLGRFLSIHTILKETMHVPGHLAEFGSWRGANLMFLAKSLQLLDPHGSKVVHCFDSFEGLTNFSNEDGEAAKGLRGQYQGSLTELTDMIGLYGLEDSIEIHQGYVEKVLPDLLSQREELVFSFVYCDVDLYDGTKAILDCVHPRLSKGGVFVLDEWSYEQFPGETKAVREFLQVHGDMYDVEQPTLTRQPSLVLRKTAH
jgi:Macrocin-O-methyltransferase (TylF)